MCELTKQTQFIPANWKAYLSEKEWGEYAELGRKKQLLEKPNGELSPNNNELKKYKESLSLNSLQKKVLIGLALGDGHFKKAFLPGSRHYSVLFEQKQVKYLSFLYAVFEPWVLTPPQSPSDTSKSTLKFTTISHPAFDYYGELFYKNNIKRIPPNLKSLLENPTLAIWFMDDGSRKGPNRPGVNLNTQCFSKEENNGLKEALDSIGLEARVHLQNEKQKKVNSDGTVTKVTKAQYRLYLAGPSELKLKERIESLILPCFAYKLSQKSMKQFNEETQEEL